MIGVDTNVLLRIFLKDDPSQHDRSIRLIRDQTKQGPAAINLIVLVEAVWVLDRKAKASRQDISSFVSQLLDAAIFDVANALAVRRALDRYVDGKAGFSDYLIAELNIEAGCATTYTFDREAQLISDFSPVP